MPSGQRRVALHKARLTTRTVADAPPERKRYILWDETLTGFGVRVSPTGRRSFIVQFRSAAPGGATANRKQVLGHFPAMAVQAARRRAREVLRNAALSPQGGQHTAGAVPTLRSAFESYVATRQVAAIFERRREARAPVPWVFPGRWPHRPYGQVHLWYRQISDAGGARFWFHACRNCFITVAIRDLMLGDALVKRLVNHAPSRDVTDDYVAPWSLEQLRAPAQRIADRIDALALGEERSASVHAVASLS